MAEHTQALVGTSCDLLGLGEPKHGDPDFGRARNETIAELADRGFRSIAVETDRVAALAVDDYVRHGTGTLDAAMKEGFTHGFGEFESNRQLIAWLREYNATRSPEEKLTFHGIDAPLEFTAASPRRDLEYVRDYLGFSLDLSSLVGDDDQWGNMEAVTDPAASPGDTAEAEKLRTLADDMRTALYAQSPELIAATSLDAWRRAKTHLTSGLGLLRYHKQAAQRIENSARWSSLSATRDALMAENLLDIRDIEADRGPTVVSAHNIHLQYERSRMTMADMDLSWNGTGAILKALLGNRYLFIEGRLDGAEAALRVRES
ncbi:erythromycin esterase family protein [Glycomyces sp. NRRL B-16210]|uniref:erythromycin esterase family protein n=1 Tax=Glycomyces sp. NRRL B-16210 TaxID=1463821 RepID=UPI00068BFE2D|nr:erythromycin esterase family protein [Glycomyces sp. NRRL B-16210]